MDLREPSNGRLDETSSVIVTDGHIERNQEELPVLIITLALIPSVVSLLEGAIRAGSARDGMISARGGSRRGPDADCFDGVVLAGVGELGRRVR